LLLISERITVLPAQRGNFVGVGGQNLKKLKSETGRCYWSQLMIKE